MNIRTYIDLPIVDRTAFELACARHGLAPMQFHISGQPDPDDPSQDGFLLVRRGSWEQAYRIDPHGHWLRQFEVDLNGRIFR
ncbi:MAG TPA: hypothetical protein VL689_07095 [Paraburkholderia sp.]|jgi:hypothetical protein|nr:hypothetical protein [Paraburkholderia sp.]